MLNINFQNGQAPALNARNMNAIVESINTLGYAVGGPNVASTVSAMTDTSKVYVYTGSETGYTAGNWYYYNGSAWVSGGVYQAAAVETDTTLTMPGVAADAKATGDAVSDLKSALNAEIEYTIDSGYYDATGNIQNPSGYWLEQCTSKINVTNISAIKWAFSCEETATQSGVTLCTWNNNGTFIELTRLVEQGIYNSKQGSVIIDNLTDDVAWVAFSFGTRGKTITFTIEGLQNFKSSIDTLSETVTDVATSIKENIPYEISEGYYSNNVPNVVQTPSAYNQEKLTGKFSVKNVSKVKWALTLSASHSLMNVSIATWDTDGNWIGVTTVITDATGFALNGVYEVPDNVGIISIQYRTFGLTDTFETEIYYSVEKINKTVEQIQGIPGAFVNYFGNMKPCGVCNIDLLATLSTDTVDSSQPNGMDVYNNTLAMTFDAGGILLYDLADNTKIAEYMLASASGTNHANQIHFSTTMGTEYPLLYISECYGTHRCFVEDITTTGSTLVQTISFSNTDGDYTGAYDWILDNYSKHIMTYGQTADGVLKIKVFDLPSTESATVVLNETDVLDAWIVQQQINETFTPQGATIVFNVLYLVGFINNVGNYLFAIDKNSHSMIGRVDLSNIISYANEAEDVALYNNDLLLATHTKRIYYLDF